MDRDFFVSVNFVFNIKLSVRIGYSDSPLNLMIVIS
jgi:hypothetical protein